MAVADSVPEPLRGLAKRVEQQLRVAHWVGEMTVTMARNEMRQRWSALAATDEHRSDGIRTDTPHTGTTNIDTTPVANTLPLEGYDSLTAAEVVATLTTLDDVCLRQVQEYEQGHRARRTILAKIDQLLVARR